jgi:hypothetical protein
MKKPRPGPGQGIIGCFSLGKPQGSKQFRLTDMKGRASRTRHRAPARPVAEEVAWNAKVCKSGRAKLPKKSSGHEGRSCPRAIPVRTRINAGGRCLTWHRPFRLGPPKLPHKLPAPAVPPQPSGQKEAPAVTGAEVRKLQNEG